MKILMLTPYLPYPLYSGGQTRSFNLIKNLSQNHEITLVSFIRKEAEKKYIKNLSSYCKKIYVFRRRPAWSLMNIILAGFTLYPFLVVIYLSRKLRSFLEQELKNEKYDLIHAETFYVMPNLPKTSIPTLLVEQTIEYRVYQHFVDRFPLFFLKPFLWLDVQKVKYWESYYWQKASQVIAVSEDDKKKMISLIPQVDPQVVPNGIDPQIFSNNNKEDKKMINAPVILYVGNFKWLQNREAVEILIKNIWPRIKKELPASRLWIVGRGIDSLNKLAKKDITFDETVTNIQTAYQKADMVLAPIKGPGGTRLKVLEAMASGCPVVTTSVGVEGIEAVDSKDVLIGDTDEELANLSVRLLRDFILRKKLILSAYAYVSQKYNWSVITKKLERIYQNVCNVR